jgi:hypothetical protein
MGAVCPPAPKALPPEDICKEKKIGFLLFENILRG